MDEETFVAAAGTTSRRPTPSLVDEYERAGPYWHHFRGIERYWRKRREAAALAILARRVRLEVVERDELERGGVRRLEDDRRCDARRRAPPASAPRRRTSGRPAEVPGNSHCGCGVTRSFPADDGELEELLRHDRTDDVEAEVGAGRVAVAVAEVAGHRIDRARLELPAEDVHTRSLERHLETRVVDVESEG